MYPRTDRFTENSVARWKNAAKLYLYLISPLDIGSFITEICYNLHLNGIRLFLHKHEETIHKILSISKSITMIYWITCPLRLIFIIGDLLICWYFSRCGLCKEFYCFHIIRFVGCQLLIYLYLQTITGW